MTDTVVHPFPPIWNCGSRILILGSFPSVQSRLDQFYYAHMRNRFWPLMERIYSVSLCSKEEKTAFLLSSGLALWDVIFSCTLSLSSDSSIRNVVPNDISVILEGAEIEKIITNGAKADELYRRYILPVTGREALKLPSTSPANAAWSFDRLYDVWSQALGK